MTLLWLAAKGGGERSSSFSIGEGLADTDSRESLFDGTSRGNCFLLSLKRSTHLIDKGYSMGKSGQLNRRGRQLEAMVLNSSRRLSGDFNLYIATHCGLQHSEMCVQ